MNNTFPFPSVSTDLTDRAQKRAANIQKEKEGGNKKESDSNMVRILILTGSKRGYGEFIGSAAEAVFPFHGLNYPAKRRKLV